MNKLLLGTTALVGASLLMTGAAYAAKPKVTVGGDIEFTAGGSDQDVENAAFGSAAGPGSAGPTSGFAFRTNSEIRINASGKTDAGMKWKAEVQIEADTNVASQAVESAIDETWIRFSGSWGRIDLGNQDGAEDAYLVDGSKAVSKAGDSGIDGNWIDFIDARATNGRLFNEPDDNLDSSDATKISYFTPRVGGVSAGVSFTPDTGAHGQATDTDKGSTSEFLNTWGVGLDFKKKFGKVKVLVSGAVHLGDAELDTIGAGREDLFTWTVGAHLAYGGWQVSGGYVDNGDSGQRTSNTDDDDARGWSAGIGYSQGPVHLGFSYLHSEVEDGTNGDDESDVFVIGATYVLGGGARIFTDIFWLDTDEADRSGSVTDNEGVGFLVGAQVRW